MKYYILIILIGFGSFLAAQSNGVTIEEEKEVKQLIQGIFDDVWGGLDSTKILDYHTEDFIILENGELWSNKEIKSYIKRSLQSQIKTDRLNSFDYISMEKQGDAIWAAYHNYATFSVSRKETGKGYWLESIVAIPTEQGWRLRMMHSTWVPQKK
ncbi:MAG: hypothetical protein ACJATI_000022 [Halioglobus sp.]|jgi:hypothetical protein